MGAFYKTFVDHLAQEMQQVMCTVSHTGAMPDKWCEGMARCIQTNRIVYLLTTSA